MQVSHFSGTDTSKAICSVQTRSKSKYKSFGALLQPIYIRNSNVEPLVLLNSTCEKFKSEPKKQILRTTRPVLVIDRTQIYNSQTGESWGKHKSGSEEAKELEN